MSKTLRSNLIESPDTDNDLEEGPPSGKITIEKERRGKSSTASFRAGRGGRASKTVVVKRFRGTPNKRNRGYVVGRK